MTRIRSLICGNSQKPSSKKPRFSIKENISQTSVIYFTGYDTPDEELDLDFTISSLLKFGITASNIHIFCPSTLHKNKHQGIKLYLPTEYREKIKTINAKIILSYISGHGSHNGVGYFNSNGVQEIMKPFDVISHYGEIKELELSVIFINQCYAGVFNFWDTYKPKYQLCIIGSTGMNSAIASTIRGNNVACNVFLYYLNTWLNHSDRDLDGDNEVNLLDMYKFANFELGKFFLSFRKGMYLKVKDIEGRMVSAQTQTEKEILEKRLLSTLEFLYTNQEPWLLNANQARQVYF